MRSSRYPGPPSTLSGSSASGRTLVRGSRRRGAPADVFVPNDPVKTSSGRKTKIILILGIALPVLACIIGITAWAVTTDVLRISPRAHENTVHSFRPRGKSRGDNLRTRQDEDVDVFMLNSLSQEDNSSKKPSSTKRFTEMKNEAKESKSVPVQENTTSQTPSKQPSPSDILSKLISDIPIPKNSKNFVVFAPVADTKNDKKSLQARRFDGKVHISDGEDLLAQETIASEAKSQEAPETRNTYIRKRKSHKDTYFEHTSVEHDQNGKRQQEPPGSSTRKFNKNERISLQPIPSGNILNNNPSIFGHVNKNANFQQLPQSLLLPGINSQENSKSMQQSALRGKFPHMSFNAPSQQLQALPANPSLHLSQNLPQQMQQQAVNQNVHFSPTGSQQSQFSGSQRTSPYHMQQNLSPSPAQSSYFNSPPATQPNSQIFQSNSYAPENSNVPGAPQYFAPPPQTFHTKVNYENSNKLGSLSSYERIAQTTAAESSKDGGQHHHHHHHHHHEPMPMGSDPIGDINLSDAPHKNDADRLGTIGLGLGTPGRGITVQIGGSPGGLGGGGLLPLSALGMARNIVSALMPRPALGLNSKVFVGLELGRGRGLRLLG
ncbi:uncharacterized protein [Parasteatoda tepidariorum]|uniref:uncharacterized protein n=1 Tax=Parasteatoda tepidariorum TaxID=114398 RepID=UPI001C71C446|nr:uncharacterized protein LOC107448603 [Parasteatoda tepidariorum]